MSDQFEPQAEEKVEVVSAPKSTPAPTPAPVKAAVKAADKKDESKTPANESAVAARAAAVVRGLNMNAGQEKTKAEPDPSAVSRGESIANRFLARAAQRTS